VVFRSSIHWIVEVIEPSWQVFKENGPAVVSNFGPLKTLSISDPAMVKLLGHKKALTAIEWLKF